MPSPQQKGRSMMMEDEGDISVKWPAARLLGPDVALEHALEFIRRTDAALVGNGFTNNRLFERDLNSLIGLPDDDDFRERWNFQERFSQQFDHVPLEHLGSHWIASAYIGGPNGPVSPSGKVRLAKNFGKWPNVEEIEADLRNIADNFDWLIFDLSVWGHQEEDDSGLPSHTWHLEGGSFARVEPMTIPIQEPDTLASFFAGMNNPLREQTWTIKQIDGMWGQKIREAKAQAMSAGTAETQGGSGRQPASASSAPSCSQSGNRPST